MPEARKANAAAGPERLPDRNASEAAMPNDLKPGDSIVILTGAGISKESGLDTFRDADGIWAKHDLADVATPEGFQRDPELVRRDVRNGLLTPDRAREIYGVDIA